jgi:hypothetical protein
MKFFWFFSGAFCGLMTLSIAMGSTPSKRPGTSAIAGTRVTDDTALYQNLSEIRVPRQGKLNFDADIDQLARLESRYGEQLPAAGARLRAPMKRIAEKKYVPSAAPAKKAVRR